MYTTHAIPQVLHRKQSICQRLPASSCASISLTCQVYIRSAYKCLALLQYLTTAFARVSEASVSTRLADRWSVTTYMTSSCSDGDSGYAPGDSTCAIWTELSTRSAKRRGARGDGDAVDKDAEGATAGVTACLCSGTPWKCDPSPRGNGVTSPHPPPRIGSAAMLTQDRQQTMKASTTIPPCISR
jgi:hypothetical protein